MLYFLLRISHNDVRVCVCVCVCVLPHFSLPLFLSKCHMHALSSIPVFSTSHFSFIDNCYQDPHNHLPHPKICSATILPMTPETPMDTRDIAGTTDTKDELKDT